MDTILDIDTPEYTKPMIRESKSFLAYLDFSNLHEPQCKGLDYPGTEGSDFEYWTPYDGRHGKDKCFLGQQVTYTRRKQDALCYIGEDYLPTISRIPCACSEMDYECDIDFFREDGASTCVDALDPEERAQRDAADQAIQCAEIGFYEVPTGYRRIPGNICTGGLDLTPTQYSCGSGSAFFALFSFKGFFTLAIFGAVAWFGWPIIEAILILLPIPDPSSMQDQAKELLATVQGKLSGLMKSAQGAAQSSSAPKDYRADFENAPVSYADDDDEEEDIGKEMNRDLTFDSDEEGVEDGSNELINLDKAEQKKPVPKLRKPN